MPRGRWKKLLKESKKRFFKKRAKNFRSLGALDPDPKPPGQKFFWLLFFQKK